MIEIVYFFGYNANSIFFSFSWGFEGWGGGGLLVVEDVRFYNLY